jgi:hypothetical protein
MVSSLIPGVSDQLVRACQTAALRDAERVNLFLNELGLGGTREKPRHLPATLLLDLAAGLRLLHWETCFPGIETGLPPAMQVLRDALLQAAGKAPSPEAIPAGQAIYRVMQLFDRIFAWSGEAELNADIILEQPDEDLLLGALADFLWTNRPR